MVPHLHEKLEATSEGLCICTGRQWMMGPARDRDGPGYIPVAACTCGCFLNYGTSCWLVFRAHQWNPSFSRRCPILGILGMYIACLLMCPCCRMPSFGLCPQGGFSRSAGPRSAADADVPWRNGRVGRLSEPCLFPMLNACLVVHP